MNFVDSYYEFVDKTLKRLYQDNRENIEMAARLLFETECKKGRIYTFGTGHSHMIGQDLYARAGGYAKVYPINEIELTLATHPTKSTKIERTCEYADVLESLYDVKENDVVIVASNSGRNSLVVEYITRLKNKGVKIIAITSLEHSKKIESRHISKKRLFELADVVLDNMAPYGDAGVKINDNVVMGPISTMSGSFLVQSVIGRFVELLSEHDMDTPVFRSSNMDGADEFNQNLFDKYVIKKINNIIVKDVLLQG